jgi:hypothetical protein
VQKSEQKKIGAVVGCIGSQVAMMMMENLTYIITILSLSLSAGGVFCFALT